MVVLSATGPPVIVLEVIGTVGFAVSGAMAATRQRMDVFGVAVLGVIAAVGGGVTLRDLLLSEPVSWLRHWWPIGVAAGTAVATIPIALRLGSDVDSRRTVLVADALGLAVFSVLGCLTALNAGTPAGVAVIIGTITGITGGIIRDVLMGQPPAVFTGQFYALAATAGTALDGIPHQNEPQRVSRMVDLSRHRVRPSRVRASSRLVSRNHRSQDKVLRTSHGLARPG